MKKLIFMCAAIAMTGCTAVTKTPVATGGSKADASVILSYQVAMFEQVTPDWAGAQVSATNRCRAWGYSKASPFEGTQNKCEARNGYGNCVQATVSKTYQCLG